MRTREVYRRPAVEAVRASFFFGAGFANAEVPVWLPSLVGFEEPENSVHPRRMNRIARSLSPLDLFFEHCNLRERFDTQFI